MLVAECHRWVSDLEVGLKGKAKTYFLNGEWLIGRVGFCASGPQAETAWPWSEPPVVKLFGNVITECWLTQMKGQVKRLIEGSVASTRSSPGAWGRIWALWHLHRSLPLFGCSSLWQEEGSWRWMNTSGTRLGTIFCCHWNSPLFPRNKTRYASSVAS